MRPTGAGGLGKRVLSVAALIITVDFPSIIWVGWDGHLLQTSIVMGASCVLSDQYFEFSKLAVVYRRPEVTRWTSA